MSVSGSMNIQRTFSCSAFVTILLVIFRMLSSITSAIAVMIPSACARFSPSLSSRWTKWWVSKWKSWHVEEDENVRGSLQRNGAYALREDENIEVVIMGRAVAKVLARQTKHIYLRLASSLLSSWPPEMQSDDVIWSVINHQFCSYKVK